MRILIRWGKSARSFVTSLLLWALQRLRSFSLKWPGSHWPKRREYPMDLLKLNLFGAGRVCPRSNICCSTVWGFCMCVQGFETCLGLAEDPRSNMCCSTVWIFYMCVHGFHHSESVWGWESVSKVEHVLFGCLGLLHVCPRIPKPVWGWQKIQGRTCVGRLFESSTCVSGGFTFLKT